MRKKQPADTTNKDLDKINYNTVTNEKKWTLDLVKEQINIRNGILLVPGINILDYVCT